MFGDPILNSKGYNYKKLEELGKWESGGTPSRKNSDYFKGTIPWYSAGELNSLYLYDSNEKITENAIKESSAKLFKKGSLFVGMYDTAAFKMGIATSDCSSNQACANILPNKEVNVLWLYYILLEMKEFFLQNRRGVRQKNLNLGMIKGFEIPYATIDLQNKFATFVQQIDKSKFEMAIYEKLWYNYQIWRKKMGLFRGILDLFSTWTISDKFGLGAGFLYADYAWEKANERELNKMKAGVTQTITNYINENRKLLNDDLIQILNTFINSIANCNKFNANSILSELKNFLMHKCAYHSCIIEMLNHSIEAIESIPEDNLDDGVKIKALQKTKNVIDCSDSNQLPILLKDLFGFYDENGIEVENKEELFDKFESLRKEYLA